MFRQTCTVAFAALAALGSFTLAMATEPKATVNKEPKATDGQKQFANSIGMKLSLVPSGEFQMGSNESAEKEAAYFQKNYPEGLVTQFLLGVFKLEHPQHRVRITKPFYMGAYNVTRGQFRQFVKDSGYKTDAEKVDGPGSVRWRPGENTPLFDKDCSWRNAGFEQTDDHPVVCVSWNDAVAFCRWLSAKEGKTYQLPTEAQWEYACRAGTRTRYLSGDDPETLAKAANVADATFKAKFRSQNCAIKASDGYVFTAPVGRFEPNAFGLYDMHGNAYQWCADWFGDYHYDKSPIDDPKGPDNGGDFDFRVVRGSSWYTCPSNVCSAARGGSPPSDSANGKGFRVARTQ